MSRPEGNEMGETPDPRQAARPDLDDAPPFLGSWRTIYLVVVGTLLALILIFTFLTEHYR